MATARPWNSSSDAASLRLVRGGSRFLAACVDQLKDLGAPEVFSPPIPAATRRLWTGAGFSTYLELALLRLELGASIPAPEYPIGETSDISVISAIDAAAFDGFWTLDPLGLREAVDSTPSADILVVDDPATGFAIVGYGPRMAYLQRVAVHPDYQGEGRGAALVTEAARRAQRRGSRSIFLNTQTDNDRSLSLYTALGFVPLPDGLYLLRG
jgi:ribosomal protein S18 acetylase RimI-like enzyme